jgi:DNA-binding NarL/FixJ family response regulator
MPKILIVDDQSTFRAMLHESLLANGHEVWATQENGGLNLFKDKKPDLVILDRNLPQAARTDLLKNIRKLDRKVKVIVLTAFTTQAKKAYSGQKVSAYFSKGAAVEDMLEAIKKALADAAR